MNKSTAQCFHAGTLFLFFLIFSSCNSTQLTGNNTNTSTKKSSPLPNVIFVVADDMGVRDTGYSGNPTVKTPNLDQMASSGLQFTQFYSAHATCSPGRMAILTGRTPLRARMVTTVGPMQEGEVTVAEALKTVGYRTAHFGKWGLGREGTHPTKVGFDLSIWTKGHYNNGVAFYVNDSDKNNDHKPIKTSGESSIAVMDVAIEFIQKQAKQGQPFFAQVCFGSPHTPSISHGDFKRLYGGLPETDQNYYGEVSGLDAALGNLRKELMRLGIEKNTLLWFVSDNGGIREASGGKTKGKIGVQTVGLMEWPVKIPEASKTRIPVSHVDMYPTILDIAGVSLDHQPPVDGISLLPLFEGEMVERPKPLGFTRGGGKKREEFKFGDAVWIDGTLKLRLTPASKRGPEKISLHDIYADPAETKDLASKKPEQVQDMLKDLATWRKSVQNSYDGKDYLKK